MKTLIGKECKFAVHIPARLIDQKDAHLVKETLHFSDGSIEPNVEYLINYERPYWVTKKGFRTHQGKKTTESIDRVDMFKSTQSELRFKAAMSLGEAYLAKQGLRAVSSSPYVYGLDQPANVYIKKDYEDKYPTCKSKYSVAAFDIETDVVNMTEEAIIASIVFENKVFTAVRSDYLKNISSPVERIDKLMNVYLGEYVTKLDLVCETVIVESEIDIWRECFKKAHEWKPDFLTIWNMDFEMVKLLEACERAGIDPSEITSDPSVPMSRRFFEYKPGPTKKVTASGKVIPVNVASRWNTVFTPSSFYIIDSMCVYKQIRTAKQEKQSYSLDFILGEELELSKLKFEQADHIKSGTLSWHNFLQKNFKLEYLVYNRFDVIAMLLLDLKTLDLSVTFPKAAGYTNYDKFSSQPYKVCVRYNFYLLEKGYVLASTGKDDGDEFDDELLDTKSWIITLKAHLQTPGLPVLKEYDFKSNGNISEESVKGTGAGFDLKTGIYMYVADIDLSSAYPSNEQASNASKETTKRELISIEGIPEQVFRMENMNITTFPNSNSLQYCSTMHNFPTLDVWGEFYDNK